MPPLTNYILEHYGFQAAFILLSGVPLQGVVCGALVISPEQALRIKNHSLKQLEQKKENGKQMKAKDLEVINQEAQAANDDVKKSKDSTKTLYSVVQRIKSLMKSLFDAQLLKNVNFVLFMISLLLLNVFYQMPFVFIADRAISYGISRSDSSFLLSAAGGASIFARLLMGTLVDLECIRPRRLYLYIASILIAGAVTMVSFGPSLVQQMMYAVCFGISTGIFQLVLICEFISYISAVGQRSFVTKSIETAQL